METKRFTKNDSGFVCANCGERVEGLGYTSRNHCPKCLCSLHLDVFPGDRAADCGGIMDPVSAEPDPKKGFIITHRCRKCGAVKRNKAARDDNGDLLIELTVCGR
ncbi:MAG: RNHCP domain-containing protein [Clostridia bacterium]|nr:RNHCP domain-containing protein [Clostridia bacterium]